MSLSLGICCKLLRPMLSRLSALQAAGRRRERKCYELPGNQAPDLYGQQSYLLKIERALSDYSSARSVAIYGSPGIGKTELVRHYVLQHKTEYDIISWFNASAEKSLQAEMNAFYDRLSRDKILTQDVLSAASQSNASKYESLLKWLETEHRVLLVYDNATTSMSPNKLKEYFPKHGAIHLIVIGSNISTSTLTHDEIEVRAMEMIDAIEMFCGISRLELETLTPSHVRTVEDIVEETDRKPHHLQYAAVEFLEAYTEPSALEAFLEAIRKEKRKNHMGSKSLTGPASIFWELSYEKIKREPKAYMLLRLFAFLDGFKIHPKLLERFHRTAYRWSNGGEKEERTAEQDMGGIRLELISLLRNESEYEKGLKPLLNNYFIRRQWNDDSPGLGVAIEMRPLDQLSVRRQMDPMEQISWIKTVICLVSHAVPEDEFLEPRGDRGLGMVLTPHVLKCHKFVQSYDMSKFQAFESVEQPLINMVLSCVGTSIDDREPLTTIESFMAGHNSTIRQRCLTAKWRSYYQYFQDDDKAGAEKLLSLTQAREQEELSRVQDPSPLDSTAVADVIFHRAQILSKLGFVNRAKDILMSCVITGDSLLERRYKRTVKAALGSMMLLSGSLDEAMEPLSEIVDGANFEASQITELKEFEWATVLLGQLLCAREDWEGAGKVVRPMLERYMRDGRQHDFITSDLALIYCEALLCTGEYSQLDESIRTLEGILQSPEQKGNHRGRSQLAAAKRLRARGLYQREQWKASSEAWVEVLGLLEVQETAILSNPSVLVVPSVLDPADVKGKAYDKAEAILSLGLAYWNMGKQVAAQYCKVVFDNAKCLDYVSERRMDGPHWKMTMMSEHGRLSRPEGGLDKRRWTWGLILVSIILPATVGIAVARQWRRIPDL